MRKAVVFKSLPPFIFRILSLCSPILRLFGKCYSFCQPTPIDYAIMVRTTDLEKRVNLLSLYLTGTAYNRQTVFLAVEGIKKPSS